MATEVTITIGSGLLPHVGPGFPAISGHFPDGTYPVPNQSDALRTLVGDPVVVINPEDFSLHVGLRQQAITVNTVAIPLPAVALENRRALVIHNDGPTTLYIGNSSVTISNGFPLEDGEKISIDIQGHGGVTVYGVAAGAIDVRILELA